jgi:hypothetical protein
MIKEKIAEGFVITKSKEEMMANLSSAGSYRSARGILNNLTIDDSNSASN